MRVAAETRQHFDRPGRQDTGVVDQQIKTCIAERIGHSFRPGFHRCFFGHIANHEAGVTVGGILKILDLGLGEGRAKNCVALGGQSQCNIATEAAAGAGYRYGSG